ncbi:MAG: hypothetical protein H6Q59_652 [Firmicutes bacterium]|nr:hypothetical protein [Bacillota bacterium]
MKRQKRRKDRTKHIIILLLSIEVLLIISGYTYLKLRPVGASNAPAITVADQVAFLNETVDPGTFLIETDDMAQRKVSFREIPDTTKPGVQEVTIIVEYNGKNRVEKSAKLMVLDMKSSVTTEAGSKINITMDDFMNSTDYEASFITNIQTLDVSQPSTHPIELSINGKIVTAYIEVVDTTAPKATVKDQKCWVGEEVEAMDFVDKIEDISDVTVSYKAEPDFNRNGEQKLTLVLTDSAGNITQLPATLTVEKDTQAPEFQGILDKTVTIGETISYKKGVTVTDNKDKELSYSVDSSKVNLKKLGSYPVTYTAKDTAGNLSTKTIHVEVKEFNVTEDSVNQLCDEILGEITKDSMTNREKAYAIYQWIKQHIGYSGDSDKSDWLAEAYRGITNRSGDCFTYFAVAQALLTRAGIDNMEVTRVGGRTRHYWNLVNCGEGWYHFDSCPNKDHKGSFMLTDKEVAELTQLRGNNYYNFDKSLYPATPEE